MSDDLRLDEYLARIGYSGPLSADFATLSALHTAHVNAIPFEGMSPLVGHQVSLDLPAIQAKLVGSRRGGYCFEQNALFRAVLEAVGFTVTGLGARVRWMSPPDAPPGPRTHMLLKVDLPEGTFLADVGFGACILETPLRLVTDAEQVTAMGRFKLTEADGLFCLSAKQPEGWRAMYAFTLEPQHAADYEVGNWFTAAHPNSLFLQVLIMERLTADKRHKLINTRYLVEAREGALAEERQIGSAEELAQVLNTVFGVVAPVSAGELFAKISA